MTQSITTLISLEEALRRARVALDATVLEGYPKDGKVYCAHLDTHFRHVFAEPPRYVPDEPELDFCSACHEHAEFVRDYEMQWESVCCGAPPVSVDAELEDR